MKNVQTIDFQERGSESGVTSKNTLPALTQPYHPGELAGKTYCSETSVLSPLSTANKELVPLNFSLIPQDFHTIETLRKMCCERIAHLDESSQTRFDEYIGYVRKARPEDWFFWSHKAIAQVASKVTVQQRTIGYLLGLYKNWLKYGFGTFHNSETNKVVNLFKQHFGMDPKDVTMIRLNRLISDFGIVYAVTAILNIDPKSLDYTNYLVDKCFEYCEANFTAEKREP